MSDSRVLLAGQVPNLANSLQNSIRNQQIIEQAPLIKRLQEQQVEQNDFSLSRSPLIAQQQDRQFEGRQGEEEQQREFRSIAKGAIDTLGFIENGDLQGLRSYYQARRQEILNRGGNPENTEEALRMVEAGEVDLLGQRASQVIDGARQMGILQSNQSVGQQERDRLLGDLNSQNADVQESAKIKLGLAPRAVGSADITTATTPNLTDQVAESKEVVEEAKASGKSAGKNTEDRAQTVINDALVYSEQLPTIRRSLELLDEVKTGGFASVQQKVAQAFGVEGADEGELSAALGKSVLSQLRATFGAAFTEKEGKRLEQIEAGFGRNAKVNRRLLKNLEDVMQKKIDQGLKRARDRGDDETVNELESNLQFELNPEAQAAPVEGAVQAPDGNFYIEKDGQFFRVEQ